MADYISQITLPDESTYELKDANAARGNGRIFYGTCATAAGTVPKEVICNQYDILTIGDILIVKFANTNSATANDNLKLQIKNTNNGTTTEAKAIKQQYNSTGNNNLNAVGQLNANGISAFVYNGTYWILLNGNYNNTYTITSVYCNTAAATAAKTFSNATYYTTNDKSYFEITFRYANSVQSALTLNGKTLYINGEPTSATNYTLPAGKYLVYYDNNIYYIRTDGKITGDITGNAATATSATSATTATSATSATTASKLGSSDIGDSETLMYLDGGTATAGNKVFTLQGGTSIPKNADMSSYKTIGNYYGPGDANAKTVTNTPFGTAASNSHLSFTLKVEASLGSGTQYLRQHWRGYNSGVEAERTSTNSGTSWSTWRTKVFKNSNAATKEGDINKPVYIAENGQATAINYTIDKSVPSNAVFTDEKVSAKLDSTHKAYLLGSLTAPTNAGVNVTPVGDTEVYLTSTAGQLNATSYKVNEKVVQSWNATSQCLEFQFV